MQVVHLNSGKIICRQLKVADTMLSRMKGLMFVEKMENMDGLLIDPCNSIHNFFVKFALDVVFLDAEFKVVKLIRNFRPWRISGIYFKARRTLELTAGTLPNEVMVGDQLEVRIV